MTCYRLIMTKSLATLTAAAATALVATRCAICNRGLHAALSVEVQIGPKCRKDHGYNAEIAHVTAEVRRDANAIVYEIAASPDDVALRLRGCAQLRALGFVMLPDRIETRGKERPAPTGRVTMRASTRGTGWYIDSPYSPATVIAFRTIPGRRWDFGTKTNFVPTAGREALWALLRTHHAGLSLVTDTATTVIPAL